MSLQPFFLLRDTVTIVRAVKHEDGHGGQRDRQFVDYATVRGRFYMQTGGDPMNDPATGKSLLSAQRGTVWLDSGQIPDGQIPLAGDRIRIADGTTYHVLYSSKQGRMCEVTLGEIVS